MFETVWRHEPGAREASGDLGRPNVGDGERGLARQGTATLLLWAVRVCGQCMHDSYCRSGTLRFGIEIDRPTDPASMVT